MSHCIAQPYKCIKCGHEFLYSRDDGHSAPVTSEGDHPVCLKCWDTFLSTVGLGYCTVTWDKSGSEYYKARGETK
jgi:DNA-directed RNA polymerase subunit RPC12/RpoP